MEEGREGMEGGKGRKEGGSELLVGILYRNRCCHITVGQKIKKFPRFIIGGRIVDF